MTCKICKSILSPLIDLGNQPVAHRLLDDKDLGKPEFTHRLALHYCPKCGLGQICDPIKPELLYGGFNYGRTDWKPETHREEELSLLGEIKNPNTIEIGCNEGSFLCELRSRGHRCVGIEPNEVVGKMAEDRGLVVYRDFITRSLCSEIRKTHGLFDYVICRQTVEHLENLEEFFKLCDLLLAPGGRLFIDVPDVFSRIKNGDITMIWEEHVNYFTEPVLCNILERFGFVPVETRQFAFNDGTVCVLAKNGCKSDGLRPIDLSSYSTYSDRVAAYGNRLRSALVRFKRKSPVVLYGVGCTASALVNGLGLSDCFDFAVDDQPEKQGKTMAGGKIRIFKSDKIPKSALVVVAVGPQNEPAVMKKLSGHITISVMGKNIHSELDKIELAEEADY